LSLSLFHTPPPPFFPPPPKVRGSLVLPIFFFRFSPPNCRKKRALYNGPCFPFFTNFSQLLHPPPPPLWLNVSSSDPFVLAAVFSWRKGICSLHPFFFIHPCDSCLFSPPQKNPGPPPLEGFESLSPPTFRPTGIQMDFSNLRVWNDVHALFPPPFKSSTSPFNQFRTPRPFPSSPPSLFPQDKDVPLV